MAGNVQYSVDDIQYTADNIHYEVDNIYQMADNINYTPDNIFWYSFLKDVKDGVMIEEDLYLARLISRHLRVVRQHSTCTAPAGRGRAQGQTELGKNSQD